MPVARFRIDSGTKIDCPGFPEGVNAPILHKKCFLKRYNVKPCNENIRLTLQLAERMIRLADRGDVEREDTGCGILYGILRDSAYKIRNLAQQEKDAHKRKGWWEK